MKLLTLIATAFTAGFFIASINSTGKPNPTFKIPSKLPENDTTLKVVQSDNKYLSFSTGLDNNYYVVDETDQGYLYLEAKAGDYKPVNKSRAPLNISLVIDRSGSMNGDKIKYVRNAAKYVVDHLSENDKVSIVMYDDAVDVLHASAKVTDKEAIKRKIDGIFDRGSTNLGGGMLEGFKQVQKGYDKEYINRVFLLSDGLANVGVTSPQALQKIAKDYCNEYGVSLSTFGVGIDYNEDLMTSLSEFGCGNYYFIKDPEFIPSIFEKELNGILNAVAQDMILKVEIPVGLKVEKVFGYKYDLQGNTLTVNFKDVFANETKAVLVRFDILENTGGNQEFKSSITYTNATSDQKETKTLAMNNTLMATEDQKEYVKGEVDKVKEQVVLFVSNDMLEQAMKEVDNGNYDSARSIAARNEAYLNSNASVVNKSEELQVQSKSNIEYKEKLKEVEVMQESEKKSMQKGTKSANYKSKYKKY